VDVVTTPPSRSISEILPYVTVCDLKNKSFGFNTTLQATFAFQFMCKHIILTQVKNMPRYNTTHHAVSYNENDCRRVTTVHYLHHSWYHCVMNNQVEIYSS